MTYYIATFRCNQELTGNWRTFKNLTEDIDSGAIDIQEVSIMEEKELTESFISLAGRQHPVYLNLQVVTDFILTEAVLDKEKDGALHSAFIKQDGDTITVSIFRCTQYVKKKVNFLNKSITTLWNFSIPISHGEFSLFDYETYTYKIK